MKAAQHAEGFNRFAAVAVRVAGAWVLAGGLLKLFLGSPADLPRIVRELPLGFGLGMTLKLVVAGEIAVGLLSLLRPRLAWVVVAGLLVLFAAVLGVQLHEGAPTCGCFGSKLPISPAVALAVDGGLLLLILASRPWRGRLGGVPLPFALAAMLIACALPFVLDREHGGLQGYVVLDIETWVGKELGETKLAGLVELEKLPRDGLWVFYRDTCEVCSEYLEKLSVVEWGEREVVLLRLPDAPDAEAKVHVLPKGPHVHRVELPARPEPVLTPPADLVVEGGIVVEAREAIQTR